MRRQRLAYCLNRALEAEESAKRQENKVHARLLTRVALQWRMLAEDLQELIDKPRQK